MRTGDRSAYRIVWPYFQPCAAFFAQLGIPHQGPAIEVSNSHDRNQQKEAIPIWRFKPTNACLQLRVQLPAAAPATVAGWVTPASHPSVWPHARLFQLATSKALAAICRSKNLPLPTMAARVFARGSMLHLDLACSPDLAEVLHALPSLLLPIPFPTAPGLHGLFGRGPDSILSKYRLIRMDPSLSDEDLVSLLGRQGIRVAHLAHPDGVQPSQGEVAQGAVSLGTNTTVDILVSGPTRPPRQARLVSSEDEKERVDSPAPLDPLHHPTPHEAYNGQHLKGQTPTPWSGQVPPDAQPRSCGQMGAGRNAPHFTVGAGGSSGITGGDGHFRRERPGITRGGHGLSRAPNSCEVLGVSTTTTSRAQPSKGRTRLATQRAVAPSLSSRLSHDVADANPFAVLAEHQEDSEMAENAVGALGKRFLEDPQATTNRAACEPLSLPEPTQDFSSPPDTSQPTPPSTPTSEVASALKRLKEAAPDQKLLLAQQCLTALIMTVDNLADDSMENQFAITAIDALKSPAQAQLTMRLAFLAASLHLAGPPVQYSHWVTAMQLFVDDTNRPARVDPCYFLPTAYEAMAKLAQN
eukprot:gene3413-13456_t